MKIAYLVPSLANKGPVSVVKELVEQMLKNGHHCSVFYFDDIREVEFCCPIYRIKFWERIDFNQFDIVHSHGIRPDMYIFCHKPFRCNTRFVTTLHNFVIQDLTTTYNRFVASIFGNLWMFMLRRHHMRVVLSDVAMDYYLRWFEQNELARVYNSRQVDLNKILSIEEVAELENFKDDSFFLGVNALLTPRKGIDLLLRAMPFIRDCKLWITGNGKSLCDLQKMTKDLGIENRVYFAGYRKDAFRYVPYYDIYMMPSRSEGFPMAMLEAVAMKKNIVCSDISVFKEIFTEEEVTFFHLEDIQSLVKAIKEALLYNKSEAAYRRFLCDYSPEKFYKGYISIYQSLL